MFKRKKKSIVHLGAKTFDGKINLIEIAKNGKVVNHFSRPQFVALELSSEETSSLISGLTKTKISQVETEDKTIPLNEIYLNGINVNQINTNYLNAEIIVLDENLNGITSNQNNLNVAIRELDSLTDEEKAKLNNVYAINPSVVIFKNFKTDLPEKKYEKLKNVLLDLFCDAIILFITEK